jgi:6-phosphogluconate dehydrogenase
MGNAQLEFGVVGLGRIGGGLALQALEKGMKVAGFTLGGVRPELLQAGVIEIHEPAGFREVLAAPREVFLYIPAGHAVDDTLDGLARALEPGDIVVDGGNSYWGDSIRRHARLGERGIHLVDVGTSGGVEGARRGACFMAGGEAEPAGLDVAAILGCWRNGSVIRSWLVDLLEEAYRAEDGLERIPSYVEDTGEVDWLVADALRLEVPIPVIAQSVMQLFASRDDRRVWARAIAAMRHGFGEHPYGPDEAIRREREMGRVGGYPY